MLFRSCCRIGNRTHDASGSHSPKRSLEGHDDEAVGRGRRFQEFVKRRRQDGGVGASKRALRNVERFPRMEQKLGAVAARIVAVRVPRDMPGRNGEECPHVRERGPVVVWSYPGDEGHIRSELRGGNGGVEGRAAGYPAPIRSAVLHNVASDDDARGALLIPVC